MRAVSAGLELPHRLPDQVLYKLDEGLRIAVHLRSLNRPEERDALIAADRDP